MPLHTVPDRESERMNLFRRIWSKLDRWIQDPAPLPADIGTRKGLKKHRPIPIELGFMLHGDGTVYFRNRKNHSLLKCNNDEIIGLVYHEYNIVVEQAQKQQEEIDAKAARRKKAALKKAQAVDTT